MPVTTENSNTTTPSALGTEAVLDQIPGTGVYTFEIDLANMAAGDVLEVRLKKKILSGGTLRNIFVQHYFGAPNGDNMIQISVPIGNDLTDADSVVFAITQTHGTLRAYPWKVVKYS